MCILGINYIYFAYAYIWETYYGAFWSALKISREAVNNV